MLLILTLTQLTGPSTPQYGNYPKKLTFGCVIRREIPKDEANTATAKTSSLDPTYCVDQARSYSKIRVEKN